MDVTDGTQTHAHRHTSYLICRTHSGHGRSTLLPPILLYGKRKEWKGGEIKKNQRRQREELYGNVRTAI
jgi:hypothetical protein